ncbi:MAG: HD domain-containing protein [Spirochaetaceae bacterium]|nr:HD domain-containing protein [Spirochaetaceae bacterium]
MNKDYTQFIEKIKKYASVVLKQSRYNHSVRTAETAEKICKLYGENCQKGYLVGIAHDICKEMDEEKILLLARRYTTEISLLELKKPSLLHGKAAAALLQEQFEIDDKEILEAVANHTFGKKNMGNLAKILFIADKIEPNRPQVTDSYLERLFALDLNSLTLAIVEENIEYLQNKGKKVASYSFELKQSLLEQIQEKQFKEV